MNAAALPPVQAALSATQHKAALWADDRLQVYAVLMGQRIGGLLARLAAEPGLDYHCLAPGALSPAQQAEASYLARLTPDSPFTDWLLFEAAAGFGDWGVLATSAGRLLDVRSHARALGSAVTATGRTIRLDWMDPVVLRALLPLAAPDQLLQVFAHFDSLWLLEPDRWTRFGVEAGRLQSGTTRLSEAG